MGKWIVQEEWDALKGQEPRRKVLLELQTLCSPGHMCRGVHRPLSRFLSGLYNPNPDSDSDSDP